MEVDQEHEDKLHKAKTQRRILIISISVVALIGTIVCGVIGYRSGSKVSGKPENSSSVDGSIKDICNVTQYPESCITSIASMKASSPDAKSDPNDLLKTSIRVSREELVRVADMPKNLTASPGYIINATKYPMMQQALDNCGHFIELAIDSVEEAMSYLYNDSTKTWNELSNSTIYDIRTSLSAAITFQESCQDSLIEAAEDTTLPEEARSSMRNSREYTSNSLAIATNIMAIVQNFKNPARNRRLLAVQDQERDHVEFLERFERVLDEAGKFKPNLTETFERFNASLYGTLDELNKITDINVTLMASSAYNDTGNLLLRNVVKSCGYSVESCIENIKESMTYLYNDTGVMWKELTGSTLTEITLAVSGTNTWLETCQDGLIQAAEGTSLPEEGRAIMLNTREKATKTVELINELGAILSNPDHQRKLLADDKIKPKPDLTVAKDGSGNCRTINDAVKQIPKKLRNRRFVIYVKEGVYEEKVVVGKNDWDVTMYGDGMQKTIISASLNGNDGTDTLKTSTFLVEGRGFAAIDIGFKNTAGPEKHQAVALAAAADSVYYRCSFDAYQDTLYAMSNRQLFRECEIIGTIDFIFGDAVAIFQNCDIKVRQPLPSQFNAITAQGRVDINQVSGIYFMYCKMNPIEKLTAQTYLGRPWKKFSRTIIMNTYIGGFVNPAGWIQWNATTPPPPTLVYGEYNNSGPGSAVDQRVKWSGVNSRMTKEEALHFTVDFLSNRTQWWWSTANVPFVYSIEK